MEPSEPRAFPPIEAGALLAVVTFSASALGTLIGWVAGSLKIGLIVGAVVGLPAGVGAVYVRYHDALRLMPTSSPLIPSRSSNRPLIARRDRRRRRRCPLFLVAGWPLKGWVIAAVLWAVEPGDRAGSPADARSGWVISRAQARSPSAGWFRSITAMVVLIAVTVSNQSVGISAAAVYALAFTVEFGTSLVAYYGGEAGDVKVRRLVAALLGLALLAPRAAASAETFDPSDEFNLKDWVPIHLGPIDMSINRAVVYLLARRAALDPARPRPDALELAVVAGHAPDLRRGDLRHRPDPGRRDGAADEGDGALVPLRRDAPDLHLRRQPARLHPAADHRPDLPRRARCGASTRRPRRSRSRSPSR